MCGIVGAIGQRDVGPILIEGLKRLEYRGYDSAGLVLLDEGKLARVRAEGKVVKLEAAYQQQPVKGTMGLAHTRWATHGTPTEANAHPHLSKDEIAIVHNGIIENHEHLRKKPMDAGYAFTSETDTEVVAHLIHAALGKTQNLLTAVQTTVTELEGAYALAVMSKSDPNTLIATRSGSPLVIGLGVGENFVASDILALRPVTDRFIFLEEGDVAAIEKDQVRVFDKTGKLVERPVKTIAGTYDVADKGQYRHFMQKEIFEQPESIANTLQGRLSTTHVLAQAFGLAAETLLNEVKAVQIVACGTSYHAGLIARYWLEEWAQIPCQVEVASEFRYRKTVVQPGTLLITISQSGETADTLFALRESKKHGFLGSLAICNVPESSLVRESDLILMMHAGPEIGVASTKAFTSQLVALLMLTAVLVRKAAPHKEIEWVKALTRLPNLAQQVLQLDGAMQEWAVELQNKEHLLFLGRGSQYPVAMEGALKLKEISYIHAESYPAGELKHGPLALVDENMPVVATAPFDGLSEKLKSNLQEVRTRGGQVYVIADPRVGFQPTEGLKVVHMPEMDPILTPILYTLPLQLLAYNVAVQKGTDVDQPRNLAKSVTVE